MPSPNADDAVSRRHRPSGFALPRRLTATPRRRVNAAPLPSGSSRRGYEGGRHSTVPSGASWAAASLHRRLPPSRSPVTGSVRSRPCRRTRQRCLAATATAWSRRSEAGCSPLSPRGAKNNSLTATFEKAARCRFRRAVDNATMGRIPLPLRRRGAMRLPPHQLPRVALLRSVPVPPGGGALGRGRVGTGRGKENMCRRRGCRRKKVKKSVTGGHGRGRSMRTRPNAGGEFSL